MSSFYEITFRYDILNEYISHIHGFITRNYVYPKREIPAEIQSMEAEMLEIYDRLPLEESMEQLDIFEKRLEEIRSYVLEHTPKPHR